MNLHEVVPTGPFTIENLLRHYPKRELKTSRTFVDSSSPGRRPQELPPCRPLPRGGGLDGEHHQDGRSSVRALCPGAEDHKSKMKSFSHFTPAGHQQVGHLGAGLPHPQEEHAAAGGHHLRQEAPLHRPQRGLHAAAHRAQ